MGAFKKGLAVTGVAAMSAAGFGAYKAYDVYDDLGKGELPPISPEYVDRTESYLCAWEAPNCDRFTALNVRGGEGNRIFVPLSNIDDDLESATRDVEDERLFTRGNTFDWEAIGRAAVHNIMSGGIEQGASTLTQQVIANLYPESNPFYEKIKNGEELSTQEKIDEKLWEIDLARVWDKKHATDADGDGFYEGQLYTLETYLNLVNYGRGAYGVEAASWAYLGKSAKDLTPLEAATIAGLPHAPDFYDGSEDTVKDAEQRVSRQVRRDVVLQAMARNGDITQEQLGEYLQVSVEDYILPYQKFPYGSSSDYTVADALGVRHAVDIAWQQAQDKLGYSDEQMTQDLRVNTTISFEAQSAVNEAIKRAEYLRDGRQLAVVVMRKDGSVAAMYGGDFNASQVNLATRPTVIGSGDKPWAYLQAIEGGQIDLDSTYPDPPSLTWEDGNDGKDWVISTGNYCASDESCTVREAIAESSNMVPLQIMEDGGQDALNRMDQLMDEFHIPSETSPTPAIITGAREASLLDRVTGMNGLIANQGMSVPYTLLDNVYALENEVFVPKFNFRSILPATVQVVSVDVANTIIEGLRGPIRGYNGSGGTATAQMGDFPTDAAGKTGTHDENLTASFIYSACLKYGNMTIGVLYRYPNELKSLGDGQTGGKVPAAVGRSIGSALLGENCSIN